MVDVLVVPQRLEERVGEAEDEDVLHRVLAEVVVDAVELVLAPVLVQRVVERHRGGQVVAERLLDDEPAEAAVLLVQPGLADVAGEFGVELRRDREVVEPPAAAGALVGLEPVHERLDAARAW